jgi:hypothetical protein
MGTKTQKLSNVVDQIVQWQAVVVADGSTGLTAVAGRGYFIDTTSGAITVTLPASPKAGDIVQLKDYARNWSTNAVTMASALFDGVASQTPSFSTNGQTITLVYMDGTKGWSLINEDTTTGLGAQFISATGGTVANSGDYKIHSFTGDGCFVVSCAGNPAGSETVDYLVVAGGGSGGNDRGGGGGAGGVRFFASPDISSYPGSPRNGPAALSVSAQTYPITVGAGGTGSTSGAPDGSNSVFSTITSAGGGGGSIGQPSNTPAKNGGSGGGGRGAGSGTVAAGNGNTPPVSPSQGSNGGPNGPHIGGGGGGFMAVGKPGGGTVSSCTGGGGAGGGFPTAFVGTAGQPSSCEQYFGGGGAAGTCNTSNPYGGLGGGGSGAGGQAGTANTGGGGQGNNNGVNSGGNGGSGMVVIRYKFQ